MAHDLAPSFERVFWRSLRDAPIARRVAGGGDRVPRPRRSRPVAGRVRVGQTAVGAAERGPLLAGSGQLRDGAPARRRPRRYRPGYERYGTLLRQIAEAPHQSCLVITSREEPVGARAAAGGARPGPDLRLSGLPVEDGRALLSDKRLDGNEEAWQALVGHCGGNGLALKVVGETTRELFGGSIADFLEYATATAGVMVGGVRQLLGAQIQRLSDLEQELLRRMAVERDPIGLAELAADLGPRIGRAATLEAVEGLRRRSLLERTGRGPLFGLHSVVLEYVTDQLIEDVAHELQAASRTSCSASPC